MVKGRMSHGQSMDKSNISKYQTSRNSMVVIGILGFITAMLLGVGISLLITKGLRKVLVFAEGFGQSDLKQKNDIDAKDEIGILVNASSKGFEYKRKRAK